MGPNHEGAVRGGVCGNEFSSPGLVIRPSPVLSPKIWRVATYIDQSFAQAVTLRHVSEVVELHPDYLSRRFRSEMGVGFHQYLVMLRLQRAITLLVTTTKSIKEICYEVGFRAPEVFSKAFKRSMGCSPTIYRIHHLPFYETPVARFADAHLTTTSPRSSGGGERPESFDRVSDHGEEP